MCRSIRSLNFELFPPSPPQAFKLFPPPHIRHLNFWRLVRSNSHPRGENCSQGPYPCTILLLKKILWVIMQRTLLNSIIKATHSQTRIKLYRVKRSPCFKRSVVKTRTFFLVSIVIFTSIERSQSPSTEFQQPFCIVLHLYWTVTLSVTTQIKLQLFINTA